ncbi:MAG TPA: hypothetical protein VFF06_24655 [Polyangia bacterium]|nr:hypothetical protein [Polyangia bacterium]
MHFVVSWEIEADEPERRAIHAELKDCLKTYSWVHPLQSTSLFIVEVKSLIGWARINQHLTSVARMHPNEVSLLVSPLMETGSYAGWLSRTLWPELDRVTRAGAHSENSANTGA